MSLDFNSSLELWVLKELPNIIFALCFLYIKSLPRIIGLLCVIYKLIIKHIFKLNCKKLQCNLIYVFRFLCVTSYLQCKMSVVEIYLMK